VNMKSSESFLPLCLAAFWGHSDIVKALLEKGANVNGRNSGTQWTACHCAAFQGHGKVIMILLEHNANVQLRDEQGRTAVDFASALDAIWPHFGARGFERTSKQALIQLKIIEKVKEKSEDRMIGGAYLSRPGSSYAIKSQGLYRKRQYDTQIDWSRNTLNTKQSIAFNNGDVLTDLPNDERFSESKQNPKFSAWRS